MPRVELKLRAKPLSTRLAWSAAAFGVSLVLAGCAAHWYETPHFSGVPETPIWIERDVLFALGSTLVALAVGVSGKRWALRPGAIAAGSVVLRGVLWALLCLVFIGVWGHYLFLSPRAKRLAHCACWRY